MSSNIKKFKDNQPNDIKKYIDEFGKFDVNKYLEETVQESQRKHADKVYQIPEIILTRIKYWIETKDIAEISCSEEDSKGENGMNIQNNLNTTGETINSNQTLYSVLLYLGYGLIKMDGSSLEKGEPSQKKSFVVLNLNDDPRFKENIIKIGTCFNQEYVLFKDKGHSEAYLVKTDTREYVLIGSFYEKVSNQFGSKLKTQGFVFGPNDEMLSIDLNTVQRKRRQRRNEKIKNSVHSFDKTILSGIYSALDIEDFYSLQNTTKYLTQKIAEPTLRFLSIQPYLKQE